MATTKGADLDTHQAITAIYNFFKKINEVCGKSVPATIQDIEEFLTHNFQLTSNGQTICKNPSDYLNRLHKFQKKYSRFECSKPTIEPITEGNRIAFQYKVDLTSRHGPQKQVFISGIATMDHNKLAGWTQVAHEKGTGDWDT